MAYVIAKGGHQEIKLAAGNDTYDFSQIDQGAQISWLHAKKTSPSGFYGNFSNKEIQKNGITLSPYQLIDPYGSVDTVLVEGRNPRDLAFWSGPTNDFVSFEENYITGVTWNVNPGSGNDTVTGGENNPGVSFRDFPSAKIEIKGDRGIVTPNAGMSLTYENIRRWDVETGNYTISGSSAD